MGTSTGSGQPKAEGRGVRGALLGHPLVSYFSIAYAIQFVVLIPYTLASWGVIPGDWTLAFTIATFGPLIAGVILIDAAEGRAGLSRLRHSITRWRVGWRWLLFVFVLIPALEMIGISLLPGALAGLRGPTVAVAVSYLVNYVLIWFAGGGLDEEVGWRGFALPRMQLRYGPLVGTLILGVLHCFWHLEQFLTPAQGGGPGTGWETFAVNFPIFLLFVLIVNVILTWIYNRTRGSIFAVTSAHTSVDAPVNALVTLLPAVGTATTLVGFAIGLGVPAILITIWTRGRLGYEPLKLADDTEHPPNA
jgi:membrane protease YdiL (CAAX protease family)